MNTRIRVALFTPLIASSLAVGTLGFAVSSAHAAQSAAPTKASCSTKASTNGTGRVTVSGTGFRPSTKVLLEGSTGKTFTASVTPSGGFAVANLEDADYSATQSGTGEIACGSAKAAEQKDAKAQFKEGFSQGFALVKADCKKLNQQNKNNLAAVDPNFEKGFKAGSELAAQRFCK
ncbi:hypothetical protein ACFYRL_34615 [Streptomyces goshikiensis]|uniref:hypothetical protein n=1 Tax=Streptomyces goshikiensis TaxID=1942 RepID=UPI00364E4625